MNRPVTLGLVVGSRNIFNGALARTARAGSSPR